MHIFRKKARRRRSRITLVASAFFLVSLVVPATAGAAESTGVPHDCVNHNNLSELIVEKYPIFPDPSNPPVGSRLQVGHQVYFKAELRDQAGNWVATSKGYSYVPYRDDKEDVILQYAQETIELTDGVIRTSGVYSVTPNNYNEWNYISAEGVSGRYVGMIGARTFQITQLGLSLNAGLYLCGGLEENWDWNPKKPKAEETLAEKQSNALAALEAAEPPKDPADSPVPPNDCEVHVGLREELTEEYGPAPGDGGEWPPGAGSSMHYKSEFRKDGRLVAISKGYSYTPFKDPANDIGLKFVQQTITFRDGTIRTSGVYNLTLNNVYEWHAMWADGVSGRYAGMVGSRLFKVTGQADLDGQVFMCNDLVEHWEWDPPTAG
ncbi:hypothetical protein [Amycolatopsis sp. 195334CR]|uniref:allene oxide cyclase barrel-like domain-containing protein n=1 Tax=Amycolatopsis sp. 195334CR TaxID=2814588 RepID=UPI001A8EE40E|nr:hypothetical protein [Amycolatopsis sp. 195334CR]MBN6037089.1 hypothetical protein [Amycolatopsis sp. 195334CR]